MTTNNATTLCLPGDILFYAGSPSSDIVDKAIMTVTNSKLVHVAIAISAVQKIESLFTGVMLNPIDYRSVATIYRYGSNPGLNILTALEWLHRCIGLPYGYEDVVEAITYKVIHGLDISVDNHFDCSALACDFLIKAGGVTALLQSDINPHEITPASLYQLLVGKAYS